MWRCPIAGVNVRRDDDVDHAAGIFDGEEGKTLRGGLVLLHRDTALRRARSPRSAAEWE